MRKRIYGHMRTAKVQISLCSLIRAFAVPLIESLDTMECINGEQMPGWDFVRAWDEFEAVYACSITKTCLYSFDPIKPHFYIVKLGFTGVYIIFLISAQNIDCGYSLEPPRRGGSNEYPQSMFWAEIWKISEFFIWKFSFFGVQIFQYICIGVFAHAQSHVFAWHRPYI